MSWVSTDALMRGLNPTQREAVEHREGPLLILAGPGSGKTRVVTHRIANLLAHGVRGREILALTFTNKAAEEMEQRVRRIVPNDWVRTSTFHRFCARLLREYGERVGLRDSFTIFDADDSLRLLKDITAREDTLSSGVSPAAIAEEISHAKSALIFPDQYQPRRASAASELTRKVYPVYQERILRANAVDFDDLLVHVVLLLRGNPELRATLDHRWRFILVDEYQDTNLAQYAIARLLSVDHPNLAVTGDPDQSIYGWRGANLRNILDFEKDYPDVKVVRLEQNYRSTPQVLHAAQTLIAHNTQRKQKELFTESADGAPVRLVAYADQWDEARSIADRIVKMVSHGERNFRDFAVFYRMNSFSRALELAMRDRGIPTQLVGGVAFFQRTEVKDLLAYARVLLNPWDDVSLLRIVNNPPRGIGKTSLTRVADAASRRGRTMLETLREIETVGVARRTETAVQRFLETYDRMEKNFCDSKTLESLLRGILVDSGYAKQYETDSEEAIQRRSNLDELLAAAGEFDSRYESPVRAAVDATTRNIMGSITLPVEPSGETSSDGPERLALFLEDSVLATAQDTWEDDTNRVTLMTLHASKGLEFPVVFIVGVEQGVLPHERSQWSDEQLEEERRLLFVGITRAREELDLCWAKYRDLRGMRQMTVPSSFLMELPRGEMELVESTPRWAGGFRGDAFNVSDEDDFSESADARPRVERRRWRPSSLTNLELDSDNFRESSDGVDECHDGMEAADAMNIHDGIDEHHDETDVAVHEFDDAFFPWEIEEREQSTTRERMTKHPSPKPTSPKKSVSEKSGLKKRSPKQEILARRRAESASGDAVRRAIEEAMPAIDPQILTVGMRVLHPTHGIGEIVEITSESGDASRTATVRFVHPKPGVNRTFPLNETPLRPLPEK